jgi:hypothetical protein
LQIYVKEKKSLLKSSVPLKLKFGINLNNRAQDGFYFYSQNRLMIMQDKMPKSVQNNFEYCGIVGLVDIPNVILAPSEYKQGFIAENEINKLRQAMITHMEDYYFQFRDEIKRIRRYESINEFWSDMGYPDFIASYPNDIDPIHAKRRLERIKPYLQCNNCLKFLRLPNRPSDLNKIWLDDTVCSDIPGESCIKPEQCVYFKEIVFQNRFFKEPIHTKTPVDIKHVSHVVIIYLNKDFLIILF